MNIPANLKYTADHEWVKIEGDTATVGVTDFAQGELGDIVYVEVETVGDTLKMGDEFGTVHDHVDSFVDRFEHDGASFADDHEVVAVHGVLSLVCSIVARPPRGGAGAATRRSSPRRGRRPRCACRAAP